MSDEHEGYGPQPPGEHELHRARERVLEADQAGGSRAEVAQAQASARQTEAAYSAAHEQRFDLDPVYRAEVIASYDGDRYADAEAGQ
jgi:hypothetical protein